MTFGNFLHLVIGIAIGYYVVPIAKVFVKDAVSFFKDK